MSWPEKVGIRAIEVYFPSQYVDQTELEQFDGASAGKYTIGLGQHRMGFCSDREDINSLCLTVVKKLLERYQLKPQDIGRLEVGTETIIDKSKSVKSVLMQLFEPEGVTDLEGIDTTNACYGGTAALFNAVNWVESSNWNGRLALVVCGDIAIYAEGPARPTGGAGAIAMIVGPNAPLVLDRGVRSTFMKHAYDFYKPDLTSEYPVVDGQLSIQCYFNALDNCYQQYRTKYSKVHPEAKTIGLQQFDAVVFHTPFCKLVQKSFARIGMNDFVLLSRDQRLEKYPELAQFVDIKLDDMNSDRNIEKAFLSAFNNLFEAKTKKSLILASQIGNMYTPSVYLSLLSHLIHTDTADLQGKSIAAFSYGSGLASSLYSIKITSDLKQLQELKNHLNYILPLLQSRAKATPEQFTQILDTRKKNNHTVPLEPSGSTEVLFPGTYYLKSIDKMHRRCYERV